MTAEQAHIAKPPKQGRGLFWLGAVLTAAYSGLALSQTGWTEFQQLGLNEKGDFLAGVFAPLAFLWLVLGFVQQGFELRNSSEALWAQMEELRNSVEQQKDLVDATRQLREIEAQIHEENSEAASRAAQPIFSLTPGGSASIPNNKLNKRFYFNVTNSGSDCSNYKVYQVVEGERHKLLKKTALLARGGSDRFGFLASSSDDWSVTVEIAFIDRTLNSGARRFTIKRSDSDFSFDPAAA